MEHGLGSLAGVDTFNITEEAEAQGGGATRAKSHSKRNRAGPGAVTAAAHLTLRVLAVLEASSARQITDRGEEGWS